MADAAKNAGAEGAEGAPPKPKMPVGTLLALVNTVAVLGALGTFVYTRMLYKRPPITESVERAKLQAQAASAAAGPTTAAMIAFEPVTVNIKTVTSEPTLGIPTQGKLHYVTIAFNVEIRDEKKKEGVEAVKAALVDRVMTLIGTKTFQELTTVQGRYILRTQMIDIGNDLLQKTLKDKETIITNVYFNQFMVQ